MGGVQSILNTVDLLTNIKSTNRIGVGHVDGCCVLLYMHSVVLAHPITDGVKDGILPRQ